MGIRTAAALIAALALATTGATPAPAVKHRDGCHPRAAKTAARNAKVRVFWVGDRLLACATGQHRPYELVDLVDRCPGGSSSGCDYVSAIRVAGRYVASVHTVEGRDNGFAVVEVVDVARREHVSDWGTGPDDELYGFITDVELSPRGRLGLIVETTDPQRGPGEAVTYEVRTLTGQASTVLDSGPDIARRSLALSDDGTLYWTNAGAPRSAALR